MKLKSFAMAGVLATCALGQTAPKPAAMVTPKEAAATSPVDEVIQLVKAGLSDNLIIRSLQVRKKPANLTPADLVKLKNGGVSENVISVMLDPSDVSAQAPTPVPAAAASPAAATPPPTEAIDTAFFQNNQIGLNSFVS